MIGRELDKKVAELVMGHAKPKFVGGMWNYPKKNLEDWCVPHFTTDVNAALEAVKQAIQGNHHWTMQFTYSPHCVYCRITVPSSEYYGSGDTEPEAMCRAALDCVKKRRQDHGLDSDNGNEG